jgi:predicted DNA-binding protein
MNRTQIYLTAQQVKRLRAAAEASGKTQSTLIREAIDASLSEQRGSRWHSALTALRGIWREREDLADLRQLRQESDRRLVSR